jgi:hypothetical protein
MSHAHVTGANSRLQQVGSRPTHHSKWQHALLQCNGAVTQEQPLSTQGVESLVLDSSLFQATQSTMFNPSKS